MRKVLLTLIAVIFLGLVFYGLAEGTMESQEEGKEPALQNPRSFTGHLIGHAHIDLSWLWLWEETVHDVAVQTFRGTLAQMNKTPGLTFAQSQPAVYEAIEKAYPDLFSGIRKRVQDGTWIPVGGMWSEPDLNMPDGESLARQLLYGKRYFLDKFGYDVKVGWSPDAFGHNAQLPQVLAKSGIKYYVLGRCGPEKTPMFKWRGQDGSEVLAYVPPGWYNVNLKNGIGQVLREVSDQTPLKDFLILYGAGDHGGGPRASDLEAFKRYKGDKNHPRLEFADPLQYFRRVESSGVGFPIVARELNFTFPGCYTTQSQTKRNNRKAEGLLLSAEKFSTLAVAGGYRDYYPERDLDEAWKAVLRNQFHDILDGSSIGPVYEEAGKAYAEAFSRGQRALDFSLECLLNSIEVPVGGQGLAVFNPQAWARTEPVEHEVALPEAPAGARLRIVDAAGKETPVQVLVRSDGDGRTYFRFVFVAEGVPSLGYKIYTAEAVEDLIEFPAGASASTAGLENEYFRVSVDGKTGWLAGLYDKKARREVLGGPGNVLKVITDEPETMSAWEIGLKDNVADLGESGASVEIVENGPVRAVLRVSHKFRNSAFVQEIILQAGLPRLDCRVRMDWQERNLIVKAAFPVNLGEAKARFEIPFGSVVRPADGSEVPALRWIDLSSEGEGYGASLLNDGKYGFDIRDNVMRISLVRGATSPDPEADRGTQEAVYALYPHSGTWKEAGTVKRGCELNSPLIVRTAMPHHGPLPPETSFLRAEGEGVVVSGLKKEAGYGAGGIILRLYEVFGGRTEARLTFPWPVRGAETDLLERPLGSPELKGSGTGDLIVPLNPYEIKTIRVVRIPAD